MFLRSLIVFICLLSVPVAAENLTVGMSLALSGIGAEMNKSVTNGFEDFRKENPDKMKNVKVVFDDHLYDGKTAISNFQNFKSAHKIDLAVVWGNTPSQALAPVAERDKTPLIAVSYEPLAKGRDWVVTLGQPAEYSMEYMADYIKDSGYKRPMMVYIDVGNATRSTEVLGGFLEKRGLKLLTESIAMKMVGLKSIVTRIKARNPDFLFLFTIPSQFLTISKEIKTQGLTLPMVGADVLLQTDILKKARKYSKETYAFHGRIDDDNIKRIIKKQGNGSYVYDYAVGYTLGQIISKLNKDNLKDFQKTISDMDFSDSPIANLRFERNKEYGAHIRNDVRLYNWSDLNPEMD